jgi:hypothetical protein
MNLSINQFQTHFAQISNPCTQHLKLSFKANLPGLSSSMKEAEKDKQFLPGLEDLSRRPSWRFKEVSYVLHNNNQYTVLSSKDLKSLDAIKGLNQIAVGATDKLAIETPGRTVIIPIDLKLYFNRLYSEERTCSIYVSPGELFQMSIPINNTDCKNPFSQPAMIALKEQILFPWENRGLGQFKTV